MSFKCLFGFHSYVRVGAELPWPKGLNKTPSLIRLVKELEDDDVRTWVCKRCGCRAYW